MIFYLPEVAGFQCNLGNAEDMVSFYDGTFECDVCSDHPRNNCKSCHCCVCGSKKDLHVQVMCDECGDSYHFYCLDSPITSVPEDDYWYCPHCKNDSSAIVQEGEKLKSSAKRQNTAALKSKSNRDWGKGFATAGRSKTCTIVPKNHFGPIPGIPVGSCWEYRLQASEEGVHRPPVGGISGKGKEGSYSIVLAGGYEDDIDHGNEFYYTGSGGKDLKSGNKRLGAQTCEQTLKSYNLALARNCNAEVNENGASAGDKWREGLPVRVCRSFKLRKHSKYAPTEGYRYDGIYKVVSYWREVGKSGFIIYRYLLRRDDIEPAPWTEEGKKRIKELGLKMVRPVNREAYCGPSKKGETYNISEKTKTTSKRKKKFNYIDTSESDDNTDGDSKICSDDDDDEEKSTGLSLKFSTWKRPARRTNAKKSAIIESASDISCSDEDENWAEAPIPKKTGRRIMKRKTAQTINTDNSPSKKVKIEKIEESQDNKENAKNKVTTIKEALEKTYISEEILEHMKNDKTNWHMWEECIQQSSDKSKFLEKAVSVFTCVICQNLLYAPITSNCSHNFCANCIKRSFKVGIKTCAICRKVLDPNTEENKTLATVLKQLFPVYGK